MICDVIYLFIFIQGTTGEYGAPGIIGPSGPRVNTSTFVLLFSALQRGNAKLSLHSDENA